jgi:hypothetical protein
LPIQPRVFADSQTEGFLVMEAKKYRDENDQLHREDGPAYEHADGHKLWYWHGKFHRQDGPAIEDADGHKAWYWHGKCHREDGPAVEYANGDKIWYWHGELHREDGPACEYASGTKSWYYHGQKIHCQSNQEFLKLIKLKAFW